MPSWCQCASMVGCGAADWDVHVTVFVLLSLSPLTSGFYKLTENENLALQMACGMQFEDAEPRKKASADDGNMPQYKVFGGNTVSVGAMPWALKIFSKDGGMCTGVLISQRHFITSSHCLIHGVTNGSMQFTEVDPYESYFIFGGSPCVEIVEEVSNIIDMKVETRKCTGNKKKARLLRVKSVFIPESSLLFVTKNLQSSGQAVGWRKGFFSDIAVFELNEPVKLSDPDIRPVCMVRTPLMEVPDILMMPSAFGLRTFGYGLTDRDLDQRYADVELRSIEVSQLLVASIKEMYYSTAQRNLTSGILITARRKSSRKSLCQGDSGGGLTAVIDGRTTLLGVFSGGDVHCQNIRTSSPEYAEVYSRMECHTSLICYHTGVCPLQYNVTIDEVEEGVVFVGERALGVMNGQSRDRLRAHRSRLHSSANSMTKICNQRATAAGLALALAAPLLIPHSSH